MQMKNGKKLSYRLNTDLILAIIDKKPYMKQEMKKQARM